MHLSRHSHNLVDCNTKERSIDLNLIPSGFLASANSQEKIVSRLAFFSVELWRAQVGISSSAISLSLCIGCH